MNYYQRNKEYLKQKARNYYYQNKEHCKDRIRNYYRNQRNSNPIKESKPQTHKSEKLSEDNKRYKYLTYDEKEYKLKDGILIKMEY